MGLFGKTPQKDPKEQVREWSSSMRREGRKLDRQIRTIKTQEAKVQVSIKAAAKKGDKDVCYILAKEIINSRKAVNKIYAAKAQLNSVEMQMKNQLATLRLAGCLEKSTEVMRGMSALVKVPEIQEIMQQMSKEMMKAGIMEEMLEDTFEGMEDQEELEEAAQGEVDKILFEVTSGVLGQAGPVAAGGLEAPAGAEAADENEDLDDMQARLESLRS
ncbi:charged multivesicular body protein 3-like [Hydractinia symbiolongicarpus]|uniref:charged multivesicular body protein 3-like n=1 Tax=Hydractinia symbiolongicarpus TaxID=13093 RepID=UPI00254FE996|nr:charged multivesicular body protein 3-like [Hydractinia symbiolongicarpus]